MELYKETEERIKRLKKSEQKALVKLFKTLKLGINFSREFTDYLIDLSKIFKKTVAEILETEEIKSILENERLPRSQKIKLIKNLLFKMRYPTVSKNNARPALVAGRVEGKAQGFAPHSNSMRKQIILAKQKGKWLKRCPGTPEHICCNYLVINNGMGCPFDCTYCYLQTYLNHEKSKESPRGSPSSIIIYQNIDNLIKKLKEFFKEEKKESFRIGTGEFTDSLALDQKVGLSEKLIRLFAQQDKHLLELKTKSGHVEHLLDLNHNDKTVFSWSLNPESLIRSDEKGTVSLKQRLEAAKKATEAGYKVSFHFDPLIHINHWQEEYKKVADRLFEHLEEDDIPWISLGALRFSPKLKNIVEKRFPESRIMLGEFIRGRDGKMRYFEPIRTEMFRQMVKYIRIHSKKVFLYLCMESPEVWKKINLQNPIKHPYGKYFKFIEKQSGRLAIR